MPAARPVTPAPVRALLGAGLLAGVLLAGCGSPAATPAGTAPTSTPRAAPAPPTPPTPPAPTATPEPSPGVAPEADVPVVLPWPAATDTQAATLQSEVDAGGQPWLLDPAEVAVAYAAAAHGWSGAEAEPAADGTGVRIRHGDRLLGVSVTQPGRAGPGGIWVVTGETAGA